MVLQPDRGGRSAEQHLVGAQLRLDVHREEAVGDAAKGVVAEQDRAEREPLGNDAAQPPAQVRERGGEEPKEDPEEQGIA